MSEQRYDVRPYRDGDEVGLVELFNQVFGEGNAHFEPRTLAQWRWLYAENPAGRQVVVGVEESGRIIAHYGAVPARFQVGAAVETSAQMIDSMVHADYRRGLQREGAFLKTARHFFALYDHLPVNAVHYGFPNRRAYPIGRRLLRYTTFVNPVPVLFRNFFQDPDDDGVGRDHADAAEVVEVAAFAEVGTELDALWARLAPHYPFAIVRDATYLRWRFDGCPWLPYRRFLIREKGGGALRGWFVTRSQWQGHPILALTDLLVAPDDAAGVAVALRAATRLARATGHARIEAWLPERHPTFHHALAAGFRTEPGLYVMCLNLFATTLTYAEALERCYYTIGDSDVW